MCFTCSYHLGYNRTSLMIVLRALLRKVSLMAVNSLTNHCILRNTWFTILINVNTGDSLVKLWRTSYFALAAEVMFLLGNLMTSFYLKKQNTDNVSPAIIKFKQLKSYIYILHFHIHMIVYEGLDYLSIKSIEWSFVPSCFTNNILITQLHIIEIPTPPHVTSS